jgi:CheY-like chemotaxis protein
MATILIVDDEKPVREFLVEAFEHQGHEVVEASHAGQALNILASTPAHPDIVISDVMMPLVGGAELCSVLKSDPATADIPVVLMSAAHPRSSATSMADALIDKPFDLEALEAVVEHLLSHRTRRDGPR